jgi:hypothetical protein
VIEVTVKVIKILLAIAFITVVPVIGAVLLYDSAVAQQQEPFGPGSPPPFDREEMLKQFDADGDGELSDEERRAMREQMRDRGGPPFGMEFRGGRPGGRGFGPRFEQENLVEKFDSDGDGKLNEEERKTARRYIQEQTGGRRTPTRPAREVLQEEPVIEEETNFSYDPKADLYDEKLLRTLYLRFPNEDWYEELTDFYRTGVEVPADLTVDGITYPSVGVRFRGNTSYMMASEKKPFNISIDYGDDNQRLYGYKTLNLLNCNADPSFIREVLYSRICRDYLPAPKANFVKLVINGENWGIYANVQQFNKDFLQEWFGTKDGVRWKVPANPRGGVGALIWNGSDVANYEGAFELRTKDAPNAWKDLVELCEVLNKTPDHQLEAALNPIFNIDRALWFIALDNVLIDSDGYISRGSDYNLYQDPHGRFHMIPYDNNETFLYAGGPGPGAWEDSDPMRSPVIHESNEMRPVISRLLSIPHLRARYLAHVRTIVDEWLDWRVLGPIIEEYQSLIDAEVKADDKKLYSYEAFANSQTQDYSGAEGFGPPGGFGGRRGGFGRGGGPGRQATPSFKRFAEERREFLLKHPEIDKPAPVIGSVSHFGSESKNVSPLATESVQVKAQVGGDVEVDSAILYYAKEAEMPFESVIMLDDGLHGDGESGDGVYGGEIPPCPAGTVVHYYVEARSIASIGTAAFAPPRAEFAVFTYRVAAPIAKGSPVVINELMASNTASLADPQGEYEDWIELFNASDSEVDLSGMYLSDNPDNLRKWSFPENTVIPSGGYLIIWADEDGQDQPGFHASFKLSRSGETLMLIDRDEQGNMIIDSVEFGEQEQDVAIGRFPDGTGDFRQLTMTPGKGNEL